MSRGSGDKFRGISAIDARFPEFEQEKQQLIALREKLQKTCLSTPMTDRSPTRAFCLKEDLAT